MTDLNDKSEKLYELLLGSWVTYDKVPEGVKITGLTKSDSIIINVHELNQVGKILKYKEKKAAYEAIKVLSFFGEIAIPCLKKMSERFFEFDELEQNEILQSMRRIDKKEFIHEMVNVIEKKPSYETLFNIVFYISELLDEHLIIGLSTIIKCSNSDEMWQVLKEIFRKGVYKMEHSFDPKLDLIAKIEMKPVIGISQEMERKRIQYNLTEDKIIESIRLLYDLTKSKTSTESKDAKKILKIIKSKIQ